MQSFFLKTFLSIIFIFSVPFLKAQTDPNADPNWDWRIGDDLTVQYPATKYTMYYQGSQGTYASYFNAPWSLWTVWDGLNDNRKEDGWVLLARDFGTPTRAILGNGIIARPYFILYNKFRSLLRVFILARADMNFTHGGIIIKFAGDEKTATLTNLQPIGYAADKKDSVKNNTATALCDVVGNDIWVWGDFLMAFDPTIIPTSSELGPRLSFQVIGTVESDLKISGTGTGINGTQKNVRDFLSGAEKGNVTVATSLPTTINNSFDFNQIKTSISGTQTNWTGWKTFIGDMYDKIPIFETGGDLESAINTFKLGLGYIKYSWAVQSLPAFGIAAGIVDVFFGGGKKSDPSLTAPTFFGVNLSLTGSITTQYHLTAGALVVIPGSKTNPEVPGFGSSVPLLYNNPVGLFNLSTTPILQYKIYPQPIYPVPGYPNRNYYDFRVKDGLSFHLNTPENTVLENIDAWLVMDPSENVNMSDMLNDRDLQTLAGWTQNSNPNIKLEYAHDSKIAFSSPPTNANMFKYQTIKGPDGKFLQPGHYLMYRLPSVKIKIKAVFKRTDDLNAIPIVAIQTFVPDFEYAGTGNWPAPPEPFTVNITKEFEFNSPEVEQPRYGFIGTDPVTVTTPSVIGSYRFAGWSDGNSGLTRTFLSGTNIKALYKIPHKSTITNAFSGNSQRKLIRTQDFNNPIHIVYESMGKVWYEMSTDNGATWEIMNNGQPLSANESKNPSIDFFSGCTAIVFEEKVGSSGSQLRLVISKYNSTINKWEVVNNQVLKCSHVLSWEIDGNPVIGWGSGSKAMVMWEHWYGPLYLDDYLGYKYLMINYYNGAITDYTNSSDGVWVVPTDLNYIPVSPAIHANKVSPEYYALAWQENTSANASRICSYNILPGSGNEVNFSNYRIPSAGKGYALNYSPSIISVNGASSRLTWAGKRSVYIDEKDLGDNPSEGQFEIRTLFADPDNTSQGWAFGNDIHSPTITSSINTSTNTVSAYVIAWSENEGASVKCINSTLNQANIKTMGITGKDVQVNNGFGTGSGSLSGTNSMYGKSFQNSTVPYSFAQSASIQSLGLNKEQSIAIGSAREGVVWKDSVEFYFSIGDIEIDGEQVDFIEIPDTAQFSSLANFNVYLLSEPFTINNTSRFQYSVLYGVSDSVTASAVLSTDGYVKYKVELFENQTGQILGTFDAVTFNQFSAGNYNNISYSVNTEGIGNKTVRLRLVMEDNISASYTVTQKYSERNDLLKGKDAKLTLNQTITVTEYSLSQNYPNPFNPATEIEFALPEQSDVTLKVYDILGKEIATLALGNYSAGRYTVPFDGTSHASGVYIYKLNYGKGQSITRKMTLLK